ncbi:MULTISPECIES: Gfo/Idh/MocA family protein [unclassified Streptomyces]|uniref:Gfo/Idh/MocA family protein n=1 Tax=unclassified Streptomyces TaxID=2593676 RepID=UPI000DDB0BF1|nr:MULTISPECIES: Gfo/Idh/MocA family oxidoreductase [unclassified Streptomyces]QZZ25077.1 Gfo/Idh/MocA family oxidoreductase [Streptomyces sp. ST1015]
MGDPLTPHPPLRVGLVGAGKISDAYLTTLAELKNLRLTAVADLDPERARAAAAKAPGARTATLDELYDAEDVDLVLNLTIPAAHATVAHAAIAAGKHIYGEKPLATTTPAARALLDAAAEAGVRVGCAPDTVLGTGVQTARAALDAGDLGVPVAANAFMVGPGPERWHPDPEFYYLPGGGPLLDMGPYYLTSLVTLLGPVHRVVGMTSTPRAERSIGQGYRAGTRFPVEVATHVTGVLEHRSGALSTLVMSFDVWGSTLPRIEVHGSDGSLSVPDPNRFDGPVQLFRAGAQEWADLPVLGGYRDAARGYGIADLARALSRGEPHRADGELAYHVLDIMESLLAAADSGSSVTVSSDCARPAAVPADARPEEH